MSTESNLFVVYDKRNEKIESIKIISHNNYSPPKCLNRAIFKGYYVRYRLNYFALKLRKSVCVCMCCSVYCC